MADDRKMRIREAARRARAALPKPQAQAWSEDIQRRVLALECYRRAAAVALYAPLNNEVATDRLAADVLAGGRPLYYPRLDASERLALVEVSSLGELVTGRLGFAQPVGNRLLPPEMAPGLIIFLPGLAFTWTGQRLGRGGGHYDRLLAELPGCTAVGLAYAFQIVDKLPEDPWDQPVDLIVTELASRAAQRPRAERLGSDKGGVPR
ncbi:MAG TPA: 5-formyltetrahydrofolate cyclo-ligase [Candidatus Binataceae bacterium]|nr:5-formyltetrahydrofolate cyclo-ligase [Candidatus Binataceae bacterium]